MCMQAYYSSHVLIFLRIIGKGLALHLKLEYSPLFLSTSVVREGVEGAAVAIILEGSR